MASEWEEVVLQSRSANLVGMDVSGKKVSSKRLLTLSANRRQDYVEPQYSV
jgi:hypothetical protein